MWRQQKEKREGKNIRDGKEGSDLGKEGIRKEVEVRGMKLIKSIMAIMQYEWHQMAVVTFIQGWEISKYDWPLVMTSLLIAHLGFIIYLL